MLKRMLPQSHAPRWMVTGIDLCIAVFALYAAALLRFEFAIPPHEWAVWKAFLPFFLVVRLGCALAGMETGRDIEVVITGLRPGEKMHEELLSQRESLLPTHHEKIMRAQTPRTLASTDMDAIAALATNQGNHSATRQLIAALIPEYKG